MNFTGYIYIIFLYDHYLLNTEIWNKMVIFYLGNERDGPVLQTFNCKIPVAVTFDIFPV